jgi:hypothetical protein
MKLTIDSLEEDNLTGTQWVGLIEDNQDPLFQGRCKIRVYGKFDARVDPKDPNSDYTIPTTNLPWARPCNLFMGGSGTGAGNYTVPKVGTQVYVTFDNGNLYSPIFHHNIYQSDEVMSEIQASYANAHVLMYDTAFEQDKDGNNLRDGEWVKIYFTEAKGVMIDYATKAGPTTVNVKPDNSVEIKNPNGDSIVMKNDGTITLTHSKDVTINAGQNATINTGQNTTINASQDALINCINAKISASASIHLDCSTSVKLGASVTDAIILGDKFKQYFDTHTHTGNLGIPTSPPNAPMPASTLSKTTKTQ